jgi:hypothetical protein
MFDDANRFSLGLRRDACRLGTFDARAPRLDIAEETEDGMPSSILGTYRVGVLS